MPARRSARNALSLSRRGRARRYTWRATHGAPAPPPGEGPQRGGHGSQPGPGNAPPRGAQAGQAEGDTGERPPSHARGAGGDWPPRLPQGATRRPTATSGQRRRGGRPAPGADRPDPRTGRAETGKGGTARPKRATCAGTAAELGGARRRATANRPQAAAEKTPRDALCASRGREPPATRGARAYIFCPEAAAAARGSRPRAAPEGRTMRAASKLEISCCDA